MKPLRDEWLLPTLQKLIDADVLAELRVGTESLWSAVVDRALATDEQILSLLSERFRLPIADLELVGQDAREAIPEALARRYRFVPLGLTDAAVEIAVADPNDLDCETAVAFATSRAVKMQLASPTQIHAKLDELYRPERVVDRLLEGVAEHDVRALVDDPQDGAFDLSSDKASERPIIKLVDHIIAEGILQRASDVHLESAEDGVHVIYRIDGVLRHSTSLPRAVGIPLVSRIKIMSGLDIADRLRPQDGRARVLVDGKRVDLRISTLPASTGEKVVVRILDSTTTVAGLDSLGMASQDLERLEHLVNLREGIVLVTGPTGSGKTTTLYASLKTIQTRGVNIVTVEDPVEYKLPGVVQVQVNEKAGLTFATALRSILRQDPDVVLVGEIRDRETAGIAIQASLTGHLVLSTLHTIDAASSVARLLDIGVESYKIAAALKGVVAQRLVRRLCTHCKRERTSRLPDRFTRWLANAGPLYEAAGCDQCGQTGYRGRLALMEVLVSDAEVERLISAGESGENVARAARESGMRSLWQSGIDQVSVGATDLDELLRVVEIPAEQPRTVPTPARKTPAVGSVVREAARSVLDTRSLTPLSNRALASELTLELVDELAPKTNLRSTRVLLAAPEPEVRRPLNEALEAAGLEVSLADDGILVLDEVDQGAPHFVVVSQGLERLDGIGVLKRLRSRLATAKLPVMVVIPDGDESDEVAAFEAGATEVVCDVTRSRAIASRIKAILSR